MNLVIRSSFGWWSAGVRATAAVVLVSSVLSACASAGSDLPDPRTIVIRSGARLHPDKARMEEIDTWYRREMNNVDLDPSFMIETLERDTPAYPWESLSIEGDTARIGVELAKSADAGSAYTIYAHLKLMKKMGRLDEFLPGFQDQDGYPLERAMVARVADVWLYGRGVFDAQAYEPLEDILYANEAGYLDAFLLTARADEFKEERQAWIQEDADGPERYRAWFLETFEREPPGMGEGG